MQGGGYYNGYHQNTYLGAPTLVAGGGLGGSGVVGGMGGAYSPTGGMSPNIYHQNLHLQHHPTHQRSNSLQMPAQSLTVQPLSLSNHLPPPPPQLQQQLQQQQQQPSSQQPTPPPQQPTPPSQHKTPPYPPKHVRIHHQRNNSNDGSSANQQQQQQLQNNNGFINGVPLSIINEVPTPPVGAYVEMTWNEIYYCYHHFNTIDSDGKGVLSTFKQVMSYLHLVCFDQSALTNHILFSINLLFPNTIQNNSTMLYVTLKILLLAYSHAKSMLSLTVPTPGMLTFSPQQALYIIDVFNSVKDKTGGVPSQKLALFGADPSKLPSTTLPFHEFVQYISLGIIPFDSLFKLQQQSPPIEPQHYTSTLDDEFDNDLFFTVNEIKFKQPSQHQQQQQQQQNNFNNYNNLPNNNPNQNNNNNNNQNNSYYTPSPLVQQPVIQNNNNNQNNQNNQSPFNNYNNQNNNNNNNNNNYNNQNNQNNQSPFNNYNNQNNNNNNNNNNNQNNFMGQQQQQQIGLNINNGNNFMVGQGLNNNNNNQNNINGGGNVLKGSGNSVVLNNNITQTPFSDIEISFNELTIQNKLGEGTFGVVYRGTWRGSSVAIKQIKITEEVTNQVLEEFRKELTILSKLRHPNIVLLMAACTHPPNLCFVTEFLNGGSLYDVLHSKKIRMNMQLYKKLAVQIAQGMNYLHLSGIIHRDIKSLNLLLDENMNVKICDFGLSRLKSKSTAMTKSIGSPIWMAPELLIGQDYTEKVDVYAFGIILWELGTGELPYSGMDSVQLALAVSTKGLRPTIPQSWPPLLNQLIQSCWNHEPSMRPSFAQILAQLEKLEY